MQTTLNLQTLKAVALSASTDATRPYLQGVLVECRAKSVTYVSTDGHTMLCTHDTLDDEAGPYLVATIIIPSHIIKAAQAPKRSAMVQLRALGDDGLFELVECGVVFSPVGATFLDWRRLIPSAPTPVKKGQTIAHFDGRLVARFAKFAEMMGWRALSARINYTSDCTSPAAVTFGAERAAFGVLMPASHDVENDWRGPPVWANTAS